PWPGIPRATGPEACHHPGSAPGRSRPRDRSQPGRGRSGRQADGEWRDGRMWSSTYLTSSPMSRGRPSAVVGDEFLTCHGPARWRPVSAWRFSVRVSVSKPVSPPLSPEGIKSVRRNPHLTPRRSRSAAALALAFAVSAPLLSLPATHADEVTTVGVDKLGDHDRELLKEYAAKARSRSGGLDASGQFVPYPDHATLILAVRPASTLDTATQIERLGGQIVTTEERVGLVTANVPFGAVDAVVALGDVLRVDVDELHELVDVTPDGSDAVTAQVQAATSGQELPDAPSASTPDANPYMPTEDLGSASFKAKNSTYDGRGITIGIMDTGID